MGTTVEPAFDLSLLYSETHCSWKKVVADVQSIFGGVSDLQVHAKEVALRDNQQTFSTQIPVAELAGSVADEWSRVGRVRARLAVLGQHFSQDQMLFPTVLGPVIPADRLEGASVAPIDAESLLGAFRRDIHRVLRRAPLVEVALTGWFELELIDRPKIGSPKRAYVHSWWRRRGEALWKCKVPSRCYVLHYHAVGVVIATHGICDQDTFSSFFKKAFPWTRAVLTLAVTQQKSKIANIRNLSRYAWKLGNSTIRHERPFPEPEELIARARFWIATGNVCRDMNVRMSSALIGTRRRSDGTWRNRVKATDRNFLAGIYGLGPSVPF